mmetsp:Transcript_21226/g.23549  ORF Transcript_21226/g.23549 Transcript_21226/m.23549 type:complete len:95 (-) Transcript_21226:1265-1549(-)
MVGAGNDEAHRSNSTMLDGKRCLPFDYSHSGLDRAQIPFLERIAPPRSNYGKRISVNDLYQMTHRSMWCWTRVLTLDAISIHAEPAFYDAILPK